MVSDSEKQRVAGLALELVRVHEPALEGALSIGWRGNFTARLGDALFIRVHGSGAKLSSGAFAAEVARRVAGHRLPRDAYVGDCGEYLGRCVARVRFSTALWPRAPREEQDNTVAHELAHLIVEYRYAVRLITAREDHEREHGGLLYGYVPPRRPAAHGRVWQRVMRELGYEPRRTHSIDRSGLRRTKRTVKAACACGDRYVTPHVAGRMARGVTYRCRLCKAELTIN